MGTCVNSLILLTTRFINIKKSNQHDTDLVALSGLSFLSLADLFPRSQIFTVQSALQVM
jgi:hypothetical protein